MKNKFLIGAALLYFVIAANSCKKPVQPLDIDPDTEIVRKECTLNGINTIGVNFVNQRYDDDIDKVYVYFTNLSTDVIDSASIIIELCEYPESYDNCMSAFPVKIGRVKPRDTIGYQFLFRSGHMQLSDKKINVGIISMNGKADQFAGNYVENNNSIYYSTNNVYGFLAKAYVYADGATTFRLKLFYSDSTFYNTTGNIYRAPLSFSGTLNSKYGSLTSKLSMDTAQGIKLTGDTLNCTLDLARPIGDTLKALHFNIRRK